MHHRPKNMRGCFRSQVDKQPSASHGLLQCHGKLRQEIIPHQVHYPYVPLAGIRAQRHLQMRHLGLACLQALLDLARQLPQKVVPVKL